MTLSSDPVPLLEVRGLTVDLVGPHREWVRVVDDVMLTIEPGEIHGLVGESGSGKSVTSLAITGLLPETARVSGDVVLRGIVLSRLNDRDLREVQGRDLAMVFQEPMTSLNPVFTVGDQIGEVVRRHSRVSRRDARQRAVDLLDEVGVGEPNRRVDDYPHTFSGGMRQRVMLAIALACSPQLLVADEPTTALDVTTQANILDLVRHLSRSHGMGVLFITHDFGVVAEICDSVSVMYQGKVVEHADVFQLFEAPTHDCTRQLLEAIPSSIRMTARGPGQPTIEHSNGTT